MAKLGSCFRTLMPVLVLALVSSGIAFASDDAVRNTLADKNCVRGTFKDYYRQGDGGDPPADYKGRVFKLSQDYPDQLSPKEDYPWLKIEFKDGAPVDPRAYLQALLDYGLEGNVEVDFYVEDNKIRGWYSMPWMDWNSEVAADWPGTDGREFVHGFTHEFDTFPKTLSTFQDSFADTWSGAYFNDRAAFGIGQVYCDPDNPQPGALNPDPSARNNMADGSYVIKLLFSTITDEQLPTMKGALEWDAHIFKNENPTWRNQGPISRFERTIGKIRMLQIDVAVRDDRSLTGWLFGTFGYDGNAPGDTPWERMVPLGIQWGNNPSVTYAETCSGPDGPCSQEKLTHQWINQDAVTALATPPISMNHLGFGGRLAGPVDNTKASCMGCHQTAGFPVVPILPGFSANGALLELDDDRRPGEHQSFRLLYFGNAPSGVVFSDSQLYSSDYSLQLSMSLQNFISRRCSSDGAAKPAICTQLADWATAQRKAIRDLLTFGSPGPDGGPVSTQEGTE
jgi:hypothetical protein